MNKNENLPLLDVSDIDPAVLKEFFDNEKVIERLNRIPKKRITTEEKEMLLECVKRRPSIIRRFNNKG